MHGSLQAFFSEYLDAIGPENEERARQLLDVYVEHILREAQRPHQFEVYHEMARDPFDYHQLGLDLFDPLVDKKASKLLGRENLEGIESQLSRGENVVLFANHQIEPEPQVIYLILKEHFPEISKRLIFVAGHRVTTDPVAIPLSLGCNLLCIHSKRRVEHPPEEKEEKLSHNKRAMAKLSELLAEGGKCIYVAPSGGRDRPNIEGVVTPDPFDAQSVEAFFLLGERCPIETHFYPLALATHALLPPPDSVDHTEGEARHTSKAPAHLYCGEEVSKDTLPGSPNRREARVLRAEALWRTVTRLYKSF